MRKFSMVFYIMIFILLLGCKKDDGKDIELKKEDKAPESLQELSISLGEILNNIGEIERIELNIDNIENDKEFAKKENTEDKQEDEENSQDNKTEQKGNNTENNNQDESKNQGNNGESNKQERSDNQNLISKDIIRSEKTEKTWNKINNLLEELHFNWNDYEVEAIKKGAISEKANQFDDSINKMTKAIEDKDIKSIYNHGSHGILNLKPFFDLYADDYRGELAEIKYSIYQYYIEAIDGNKEEALNVIKDKDGNIQKIKLILGEEKEEKIKELEIISYSLKNLANSLNEDSRRLYIIKKDTAIQNINQMENNNKIGEK